MSKKPLRDILADVFVYAVIIVAIIIWQYVFYRLEHNKFTFDGIVMGLFLVFPTFLFVAAIISIILRIKYNMPLYEPKYKPYRVPLWLRLLDKIMNSIFRF